MEHKLKIYPNYFGDVLTGKKKFEIRKNDRNFCTGDVLLLREWDNTKYSGKEVKAKIIYMLDDRFVGIQPGYAVLGIKLLTDISKGEKNEI